MMRTRTLGVAAAAPKLALSVAAYGGDEPAATDPTDLRTELTWWDTSDPTNEGPAFRELIAKFNEQYPNITINYQSVPFGEAQNKLKTATASGSGALDILRAEVAWVLEFASLGYLYALEGSELTADVSDYVETPLSSTRSGTT